MSNEARYELYMDFCHLVGSPVKSFDWWLRESQRLDNIDVGVLERRLRYGSDLTAE